MESLILEKEILLTFKVFRHYNLQHMFGWSLIGRIFLIITCPLLFIFTIRSLFEMDSRSDLALIMILTALIGMIFILLIVLLLRILLLKKRFISNKLIHESYRYQFKNEGLIVSGSTSNSSIQWNKIYKVKESSRLIAIYISRNQAFLFPKDLFSQGELKSLKRLLFEKLSKKQLNIKTD